MPQRLTELFAAGEQPPPPPLLDQSLERLQGVVEHLHSTLDAAAIPEVARFYGMFLRNAKKWGRLYEMGLMGMLNLRDGKPFLHLVLQ